MAWSRLTSIEVMKKGRASDIYIRKLYIVQAQLITVPDIVTRFADKPALNGGVRAKRPDGFPRQGRKRRLYHRNNHLGGPAERNDAGLWEEDRRCTVKNRNILQQQSIKTYHHHICSNQHINTYEILRTYICNYTNIKIVKFRTEIQK